MIRTIPHTFRQYRHRQPRFPKSLIGKFSNWITTTWFRFNMFLLTIFIIAITPLNPVPVEEQIIQVLISPIMALIVLPILKFSLIIMSFIPYIGTVWGFIRILYYYLFSPFVLEPAPSIIMPAWFSYR